MNELSAEVLIVGGGLGGVAAALAALRLGKRVVLTEETGWPGGQLTSQGVPPDEHAWIESTGCTATYRRLREGIRDYYRRNYPLLPEARADPHLNPGLGAVSLLCHEPRVALAVIEELLAPYRSGLQLQVLVAHRPVAVETTGDRATAVVLVDDGQRPGERTVITAPYVLDATELGELLALAGVEHVVGAESQAQTGELHALPGIADPLDQQAYTWCFAVDYHAGEDHTISRPPDYDFWRDYRAGFWPAPQLSWTYSDPITLEPITRPLFEDSGADWWHYRRNFHRGRYPKGLYSSDTTVINWPQNDYWLGPLVGVAPEEAERHLEGARQLSLSLLYWMQTEAPRPDGGVGYPGLRLRGDIMGGTVDGLAMRPYVRESRRIRAEFTVLEQHIGVEARGTGQGAEPFSDSVGLGSYRIDLHPSYSRNYIDVTSWPYQIPLGALLPVRMENLLPAAKNLGVTHVTNGCYRVHSTEWNIGEAAGALAAYCLERRLSPRQVRNNAAHLEDYQRVLVDTLGFQLAWPEAIRLTPRIKRDPLGM